MSQRILVVDDSATVRRVVGRTLTQAGYDVCLAVDGRDGLEKAQSLVPDLVLTDFVMPHMNGLRFVQGMRQIANLSAVPVILMSAKADKIGDGFVAQTGAIDAITKPFSPEALLAVTGHALSRFAEPMRESVPPAPVSEVERISSIPPLSSPPPPETSPAALAAAAEAIAERLAGLLADPALSDPASTKSAIVARFEPAELFAFVNELAALVPGRDGEHALEGRLEHVSLGEILQLLTHQRQSGVLEIEKQPSRSRRSVTVCMKDGAVSLALGQVDESQFRLGRYLLREGLIDREDLERIVRNRAQRSDAGPSLAPEARSAGGGGAASRSGASQQHQAQRSGLLGTHLVKLGYISADELSKILVQQTSELIYEALRWRRGRFRFLRFATRPEAADARLGLPLASILMEGLRRVDEWRLIEEQIRSFDDVPRRDEEALAHVDPRRLSAEERRVLETVDGARTVREVVEHTRMASFDACKILFQLTTSRLVRVTPAPERL